MQLYPSPALVAVNCEISAINQENKKGKTHRNHKYPYGDNITAGTYAFTRLLIVPSLILYSHMHSLVTLTLRMENIGEEDDYKDKGTDRYSLTHLLLITYKFLVHCILRSSFIQLTFIY